MDQPCTLCPRRCGVRRHLRPGYCHSDDTMRIAFSGLHRWEEPCLTGTRGAGTVFFTGCGLGCAFCQNHAISRNGLLGRAIAPNELAECFLSLQKQGACNIELVTATHHRPGAQQALRLARTKGLRLPLVWNTGGYETSDAVRELNGDVDVWLFDLKFHNAQLSAALANAPDYFVVASAALLQAFAQTGPPVYDGDGLLQKGVMVRILVLPGHRDDAKALLHWLAANLPPKSIVLSLMRQYTPPAGLALAPPLHRRLASYEYRNVRETALALGFSQGYFQQRESAGETYVPPFKV